MALNRQWVIIRTNDGLVWRYIYALPCLIELTHWGQDEMDISQTTSSNVFYAWISISLKFVPKGTINNIPALVQIMAWRHPGDKPLSEPMMVSLPTHIYVTQPQRVTRLLAIPKKRTVVLPIHFIMRIYNKNLITSLKKKMNMHTHTVNDKSVNKQKHAKVQEKSRKNGEGDLPQPAGKDAFSGLVSVKRYL